MRPKTMFDIFGQGSTMYNTWVPGTTSDRGSTNLYMYMWRGFSYFHTGVIRLRAKRILT